jgi:polyhydroxybutyrate depolymerase
LLALHGYGGDGGDILPWLGLSALADRGVYVVAPDGTTDSTGRRFWNAGATCCDFENRRPDDIHYLSSIVDDVAARADIDRKRVYAVGLSNGGAMALRLACNAPETFAAVVSISGPNGVAETCAPKVPVSVRLVHGTADKVVPFMGGDRLVRVHPNAKGALASIRDVATAWARREGCAETPTQAGTLDLVPELPGEETRVERFTGCTGGAVELFTIEGGPHVPPLGPQFVESTWSFLSAHAR